LTGWAGDYDGDTAIVIWTPDIVEPFENADEKYSIEPEGLDKCFQRENEQVDAFLQRTASHSPDEKVFAVQQFLLGSLRDTSIVGKYSTMHDNAIYSLGYKHPRTIRLAYKWVCYLQKLFLCSKMPYLQILQSS
jgi:RNA-dependent RNA polymerase